MCSVYRLSYFFFFPSSRWPPPQTQSCLPVYHLWYRPYLYSPWPVRSKCCYSGIVLCIHTTRGREGGAGVSFFFILLLTGGSLPNDSSTPSSHTVCRTQTRGSEEKKNVLYIYITHISIPVFQAETYLPPFPPLSQISARHIHAFCSPPQNLLFLFFFLFF